VIKRVNPGSRLELEGSFELSASLAELENPGEPNPLQAPVEQRRSVVFDREGYSLVSLADLLRSFLEDPTEKITGPIRITIEPA